MIAETSWITKTPGVCGAEPCVRDTRHTISGLVEWKRLGLTDERIIGTPPVSGRPIPSVELLRRHPGEIDAAIRESIVKVLTEIT